MGKVYISQVFKYLQAVLLPTGIFLTASWLFFNSNFLTAIFSTAVLTAVS